MAYHITAGESAATRDLATAGRSGRRLKAAPLDRGTRYDVSDVLAAMPPSRLMADGQEFHERSGTRGR